ncbi:MAG: hypothetical protein R3D81_03330 [Thalassovita sp.]
MQKARADLSQALADRTNLPKRFTEDPVKTAILISSTETLEGSPTVVRHPPGTKPQAIPPDISHKGGAIAGAGACSVAGG